jgi:hypothetical protein
MVWTDPRTWVAGEKPSASTLNTHIRDNFKAIGDPWTSYTVTLGNSTPGNGTLTGNYIQAGKLVAFRIQFILGSTSAITGSPTFTLPVAAAAARTFATRVLMWDSSASAPKGGMAYNSATGTLSIRDSTDAAISSTNPFTWATSDEITIVGTYEAA